MQAAHPEAGKIVHIISIFNIPSAEKTPEHPGFRDPDAASHPWTVVGWRANALFPVRVRREGCARKIARHRTRTESVYCASLPSASVYLPSAESMCVLFYVAAFHSISHSTRFPVHTALDGLKVSLSRRYCSLSFHWSKVKRGKNPPGYCNASALFIFNHVHPNEISLSSFAFMQSPRGLFAVRRSENRTDT